MRDFWLLFVSNHLTTPMQWCGRRHRKATNYEAKVSQVLKELVTKGWTAFGTNSSSNIYYEIIITIWWVWKQIYRNCVLEYIFALLLHTPWHRPLLAQPGPRREAIHCAFLSSLICTSILIATCLLLAASLAAGVIRPTLAKVHMACALTAHVDMRRRYCPTIVPRRCSDSGLPEDRQMWETLASAQVWTSAWRSSEPSPQLPTTKVCNSPKDWSLLTRGPTSPSWVPWCNLSSLSSGLL